MMLELFVTPKAIEDLEEIFKYTAQQWSVRHAEIYQDLLFESMKTILHTPKIGIKYYYYKGDYRMLSSGKHIIFYKLKEDNCVVVRILHERMDLNAHFL